MNTVFKFQCPNCGQTYETESKLNGEFVCEKCQFSFILTKEEFVSADSPDEPAPVEEPPQQSVPLRAIDMCSDPAQRRLFIITTTGNEISGQAIEKYLGIARGIVVRSPTSSQSLFGGLARLSLLGQGAARKSLQIRAGLQKVCTKLTPAAVGLSA